MIPSDNKITELRERAEKRLQAHLKDPLKIPPQELTGLIHELQVYQIELEVQNEELRRAQAELSVMRDWYANLYDFAPVGYLTLNDKNVIVDANLTAVQMLECERAQLITHAFLDLVTNDNQDACYQRFRRLRQAGGSDTSVLRMYRRTGSVFWARLNFSSFVDLEGDVVGLRLSLTDISELKDFERSLEDAREMAERSLAQLRAVVENADVGLVFGDADGNLIEWNPAALEMVGFDSIERARVHIGSFAGNFELYSKDGQFIPFENWPVLRLLRGEEFSDYEFHMRRIDTGFERVISVTGVCLRLESGDISLVLLTMRDLTAVRATEAALRKAKETADQANASKTQFLEAVSHDLRQPLQTIKLLSGILSRKVSEPDLADLIKDQRVAVDAMTEIMNRLLNVSQLKSGGITPQVIGFPVAQLIEKLVKGFKGQTRIKGLELRAVPVSATIHSDPVLLEQILRNLLANAIRYTERGGVLVGCRRRGRNLHIEVWDTGIGIPEDEQHAVFNEFYQLHNPAREAHKGQGLGLSIVKKTAKMLGHAICVRSIPGKGSKFAVEVPLAEPADRSPAPNRECSSTAIVASRSR